jgi:hypothetical protein
MLPTLIQPGRQRINTFPYAVNRKGGICIWNLSASSSRVLACYQLHTKTWNGAEQRCDIAEAMPLVVHAQTSDHDNGSQATQANDGFIFQSTLWFKSINAILMYKQTGIPLKLSQHLHRLLSRL